MPALEALSAPVTPRRMTELREIAANWFGMAEIHFADAQAQAESGNTKTAIEQCRFAEAKLATARTYLLELSILEERQHGR